MIVDDLLYFLYSITLGDLLISNFLNVTELLSMTTTICLDGKLSNNLLFSRCREWNTKMQTYALKQNSAFAVFVQESENLS